MKESLFFYEKNSLNVYNHKLIEVPNIVHSSNVPQNY